MARPKKSGLDYLAMDVDLFQSRTFRYIISLYQSRGVCIAIMLLTEIYRKGYFLEWDKITKQVFLDSLPRDCDEQLLDSVINDLIHVNFFNKECFFGNNVLTSENIQLRYFGAKDKKAFDIDHLEHLLIPSSLIKKSYKENQVTKGKENQDVVISEKTTSKRCVNSKKSEIIPESKVKKSKVNNNISPLNPPLGEKKEENPSKENLNEFQLEENIAKDDTVNYNYYGLVARLNDLKIPVSQQSQILAISHYGMLHNPIWIYIAQLNSKKVDKPGSWLITCMENHRKQTT